jgi:hypothetical protein
MVGARSSFAASSCSRFIAASKGARVGSIGSRRDFPGFVRFTRPAARLSVA